MSKESILAHYKDWDHLHILQEQHFVSGSCLKIRRASWERSRAEVELVEQQQLPVSQGEWKAGTRKEWFEWEVRDAILSLWDKGFTTYYSGYDAGDGLQVLNFVSLEPPPEDVEKNIWALTDTTGILTYTSGAGKLDNDSMCMQYNDGKPIWIWGITFIDGRGDPQRIKNHWDLIAKSIPNLGWQQLVNTAPYANDFRAKHQVVSNGSLMMGC